MVKLFFAESSVSRVLVGSDDAVDAAWRALAHLEAVYPGFGNWFDRSVIPGIRSGERRIFVSMKEGNAAAVAIAKRALDERKLCTLWVSPCSRVNGLAAQMASHAFEWLGTDKPLFTVPSTRLAEFRSLIEKWNFQHCQSLSGYYTETSTEHVFNGRLMAHN